MRNLIIAVTVALVVSACVTTRGTPITQAQLDQIIQGQTTKSELLTIFGNPIANMQNSDGTEVLSWGYYRVDVMNGSSQTNAISVIFDESGKVKSYSTTNYGGI